MYFSSFVCLLVVINISFSVSFPYFIRTLPKNVIRYNTIPIPAPIRTIPTFPLNSQFQRRRPQSQYSFNKVDVFPDEQFIEQRKIDDRDDGPSDESSDLHPIYVLPPPNFQPIVYPTSRSDSALSASKATLPGGYLLKPQLTYDYPNGVSSWIFGGLSGTPKDSYWNQLAKDLAHTPVKAQQPKQVVIYLKRTEPKGQHKSWSSFPVYEAHSVLKEQSNTIHTILNKNKNKIKPTNDDKGMKTKLPVGMTSFFLGGMRGISGRHWQMPSALVSQVEFMPNDNNVLPDNKKYKPGVQFDDDNDFYNYNVIRDHK